MQMSKACDNRGRFENWREQAQEQAVDFESFIARSGWSCSLRS
jgi:hypothetical protein